MSATSTPSRARLADPSLRRAVEAAVRRRVRGDEAEDVVQATFTDVLASAQLPEDEEELRRFVFGVARNKVFDHFRRQKRQPQELEEGDADGGEQPLSARDMLRWAEGALSDAEARDTLEWMLREGEGEKLEHIARDARIPAPRLRKRVSRLRKLLRERWAAELMLAGLGALLLLAAALYLFRYGRDADDVVEREPAPPVPSAAPRAAPSAPSLPPSRPAGTTPPAPPAAVPSASAAPSPRPTTAPRSKLAPSPVPLAPQHTTGFFGGKDGEAAPPPELAPPAKSSVLPEGKPRPRPPSKQLATDVLAK